MEKAPQVPEGHKVLITGSSGMLGVDLCQELRKDYDVYGLDIVQRTAYNAQRFYRGDITDRKDVEKIVSKIKPEVAIHSAAWTDVDGCELDKEKAYRINSHGTENVALACKRRGAALIYISTDFVFDGRKKRSYKEIDKPNPINVYGDSKFKGEEAVKKILKRYFIVRTSWLYGRRGKNFVNTILEKAKEENLLKVVDDQIGSPTYTKDLVKAIHVLLDKIFTDYRLQITDYGAYHITNSGDVSWYGYAKKILKITGSEIKVAPITAKELGRLAKRPAMSVLDNSKFIEFTNYRMRNWRDALKEYLNAERAENEDIE